jgi:hypothetical protein
MERRARLRLQEKGSVYSSEEGRISPPHPPEAVGDPLGGAAEAEQGGLWHVLEQAFLGAGTPGGAGRADGQQR